MKRTCPTSKILAAAAFFVLFVWLARGLLGFTETYGCIDAGGSVRDGICVGGDGSPWPLVSSRPFLGWIVALGLPALVTVCIRLAWDGTWSLLGRSWNRRVSADPVSGKE